MNDGSVAKPAVVRMRVPRPPTTTPRTEGRRSRRRAISQVFVHIEAPALDHQAWVTEALDLNVDGMGLVLPPALPVATGLLLTFRLGEEFDFSRVPALLLHREPLAGVGGVHFLNWDEVERARLIEFLARN